MMRKWLFGAAAAAALVLTPRAEAQVLTPTFQSPVPSSELGIYVIDYGDVGVEGVFRRRFGRVSDLGLRIGFADGDNADALLLGADFRSPLQLAGAQPLGVALTLGAQAALLDADAFGVQGGVSVGYTFASPELRFTPYIHPRLALVDAGDDAELDLLADIGVDVGITPDLDFRLGVNVGDGADWGIGLAFRR